MKKLNKMMAVVLALVLCLSLMPLSVFAADPDCEKCGGTGTISGKVLCSKCGGWGNLDGFGKVPCDACDGAGFIMSTVPCGCNASTECSHKNPKVVVFKEADCTHQGEKYEICADCGEQIRPILLRALGHDKQIVERAPTCTQSGGKFEVCKRCGWEGIKQTYPMVDHMWIIDTDAEQVEDIVPYKCETCDAVRSEACLHENTSTEHVDPSCETAGKSITTCDVCGKMIDMKIIEDESALGHKWDNGVMYGGIQKITYTCTACGKTYTENKLPEKPYEREIEVCMGFQTADGSSFSGSEIPTNFSVTYSYEWQGETITVVLPLEKATIVERPKAYQDENGKWIYNDDAQEKYATASWKIRVPVDPSTGEPMKGTALKITESGYDIDGYEWDHAYGYNPEQSTDGTGILYVPSNGSTVTWVYNVYAKTASYTINYYYGGVLGSTSGGTARVGSTITVSRGPANYNGETYVFSSVSGDTTIGKGGNVINVYYVLPEPDTDPGEPTDPTIEIDEPEVPLASAEGLNDVDHMAYIIGYEDDTVRPLDNITRAEVATIFFRLMTDLYRTINWSTTNDFIDVNEGDWFNNAVSTCANAGIVDGYADGTFLPNKAVTRAEFAAIVARFLGDEYTGEGIEDFSDTADHWAAEEIRRCVEAGWVTTEEDPFRPEDLITRAEVMTIINRMLHRTPDEDHMIPTMKTWIDNPKGTDYYEAVQEATNEHEYERDEAEIETWTNLLEMRDWAALEAQWAADMADEA